MELEKIVLNNFNSYSSASFNLKNQGMCGILGNNGAGKSSILDAITFALFGTGTDDIVNTATGCNTKVELYGSHNDLPFSIVRYRKHKEHKNNVLFYLTEDTPVKASTNTETQKKIEQFLGLDYKTFTNTASFSAEAQLFASADDSTRKAIFEKILQDLDVYNLYLQKTKDKLRELSDFILTNEREIEILIKEQNVLSSLADGEKERSASFEAKRRYDLQSLLEKRKKIENRIEDIKKIERKFLRYKKAEKKLEEYNESFVQKNTRKLEAEKSILEERKNFLIDTDKCPTCLQNIDKQYKDSALNVVYSKLNNIIPKLEEARKVDKIVGKINKQMAFFLQTNSKLETQTAQLKYVINELNEIDEEISSLKNKQNTHNETYLSLIEKLHGLSKVVKKKTNALHTIYEEQRYLEEVTKAFSKTGIPNTIISRTLSYLEQRANYYLSLLSDDSLAIELTGQATIKTGALRNKIGLNILSPSGIRAFSSFSGGEKQRINIAILLGLRDVALISKGLKINVVFLDEVLDLSLDADGIENTLSLLQSIKRELGNIFIFSPKNDLITNSTTGFDNIFYVVKDNNGFSQIYKE